MLDEPAFNHRCAPQTDSFRRTRERRRLSKGIIVGALGILDGVLIFFAWAVAYYGYYRGVLDAETGVVPYATLGILGAATSVMLIRSLDWYDFDQLSRFPFQLGRTTLAFSIVMAGMVSLGFLSKMAGEWSRGWLLTWYGTGLVLLWVSRYVMSYKVRRWDIEGRFKLEIVVVGDPRCVGSLLRQMAQRAEFPGRLLGLFYDEPAEDWPAHGSRPSAQGDVDDLLSFARTTHIDRIIIALPWAEEERATRLIDRLKFIPCDVRMSFDTEELQYRYREISEIGGLPVLHVYERPLKDWQVFSKRAEDLIISAVGIILTLPLNLLIALLIKLESPGPILFQQPRHGFNHAIFSILKFRTMYVEVGDPTGVQQTTPVDSRVTRIGRILRRWSLDELPQLWNVWRGDMSIVGPRPHPIGMRASGQRYEDLVEDYAARHRVKPGLTGWAQVNGWRGPTLTEESARKRIEFDLHYIENWSLWYDLKIILMTTIALLWRDNLDEKPATIRMRIGSGDVVMIVAARQAGKYYFCSR